MSLPTSYAYQWNRNGSAIGGANAASYTPVSADTGLPLTCLVTGSNLAGAATATSNASAAVAASSSTALPTTGNLINRVIFGSAGPGLSGTSSALGVHLGAYNTYWAMSTTSGGWSASDASACLSGGTELHVSWDVDQSTPPTFANIANGSMDNVLASFFASCKAHGKRILLRMWWEMNLPQGQTKVGNSSSTMFGSTTQSTRCAEWIAAWQHIYNYCHNTAQCTNVLFYYCPNGSDGGGSNSTAEQTWPGLSYVDVTGIDTYNQPQYSPWETFPNMAAFNGSGSQNMWQRLLTLAPNLPMGIGECGCVPDTGTAGQTQANWLTSMFTCQTLPNLRWLDYFDEGTGWPIVTSASLAVAQQYVPQSLGAWTVFGNPV
jgi:hypothetical protein